MYSVIDTWDGSVQQPAQGIFRLSNVQYTPGSILNGGLFTNFFCFPPTNLPAINQVVTATSTRGDMAWSFVGTPTITYTNFVSGLVYHNLSGRPLGINAEIAFVMAAVNGASEMAIYVDPANGTAWPKTNVISIGTTVSTPAFSEVFQLTAFAKSDGLLVSPAI